MFITSFITEYMFVYQHKNRTKRGILHETRLSPWIFLHQVCVTQLFHGTWEAARKSVSVFSFLVNCTKLVDEHDLCYDEHTAPALRPCLLSGWFFFSLGSRRKQGPMKPSQRRTLSCLILTETETHERWAERAALIKTSQPRCSAGGKTVELSAVAQVFRSFNYVKVAVAQFLYWKQEVNYYQSHRKWLKTKTETNHVVSL